MASVDQWGPADWLTVVVFAAFLLRITVHGALLIIAYFVEWIGGAAFRLGKGPGRE